VPGADPACLEQIQRAWSRSSVPGAGSVYLANVQGVCMSNVTRAEDTVFLEQVQRAWSQPTCMEEVQHAWRAGPACLEQTPHEWSKASVLLACPLKQSGPGVGFCKL
jgi:hypothetical protein